MLSQPIQSCITLLRESWRRIQPCLSGRALNCALIPTFATTSMPAQLVAGGGNGADTVLIGVLAGLAGVLGVSAGMLYRHSNREVERTTQRAQNAEAELRALLLMTDEAMLVLESDGTIRTANPAAEEIFERPADELPGLPLTELIAQPLSLAELTKHGPANFETMTKRSDGAFPKVEMMLSPVDYAGRVSYVAVVHASKTAPMPIISPDSRSPELMKPLEKFTHDLNNELTSIIGSLSLILMSSPSDPANHDRVVSAKRTAVRVHALNQNLQAIAHGEQSESTTSENMTATTPSIVRMPMTNSTQHVSPTPGNRPNSPTKPKILILDDEEAICALLVTALGAMGFEATEATSVRVAIEECQNALREGNPFDLVISDLSLPGEMSGKDAVAQLRSIDPQLIAIVSSGYDSDPIMTDCRNHGFDGAIAKPYDIGKLARTVREVLATSSDAYRKSA